MTKDILQLCKDFNLMYKLSVSEKPSLSKIGPLETRLKGFKRTLADELDEIDEIKEDGDEIDILVEVADLLGDICVYCISEAVKYGIPLDEVIEVIMSSNFSKKNADGSINYDENGKLLKGDQFFKPESKIKSLLKAAQQIKKPEINEEAKYFEKNQEGAA